MDWMIYGANGYTGRLVALEAKRRGLTPVLAGRNASEIERMGADLDCPARVFALDDPEAVKRGLEGMGLVLHCAGPFSSTCEPMLDACLDSGVHYLDITGEISVFDNEGGVEQGLEIPVTSHHRGALSLLELPAAIAAPVH